MNETGSTLGSFSFVEATENEGLDIQAIFGHAETDNDTNLFDEPQETRAAPASPEPRSTTAESVVSTVADNVSQMAFQQQEAENTQKGLFDKPPVFSYGGVKEDIKDTSMTFEELRIAKSEDFPELSDGKKVSWTVEYGKTVKAIADPKGTTILSVKKEVEQSPDFLNNLKKSKDKNPSCLVKPKVISQSKGIALYKGIFSTVEEARASDKNICLIPAKDGRVYELRKTEMGEFLAPKDNIAEFSTVRAGFIPALPRIPRRLIQQSIAFFRYFIGEKESFEALLHVYWDRKAKSFVLDVPHQQVSTVYLDADLQTKALPGERYLHYADIHSHNRMEARFSQADDLDELATRIYIVIGHLDRYFPTVAARISCGGVFYPIALGEVAEPTRALPQLAPYPAEQQKRN